MFKGNQGDQKDTTGGNLTSPSPSTPSLTLPSRPTGLPSDSHLKGSDNYAVWTLQMETVVGIEAYQVMSGNWLKGDKFCTDREWEQLDSHARQCITLSCSQEVMKEITGVPKTAYSWWSTFKKVFQPHDAQGHHRLLSRLFSTSLTHASPESLKTFAHDYLQMVSQIQSEDIKVEEILSSHLLSALPTSLSHFQTSLALTHPNSLPDPRTILELLHNELARTTPSSSVALAASTRGPPPGPCPACRQPPIHWMVDCPHQDLVKKYKAESKIKRDQQRARANLATSTATPDPSPSPTPTAHLANILETQGVEAWLSSPLNSTPPELCLDSGCTHPMSGEKWAFSKLQA
ncbi:hypothetical protein JCM5350_007235, partial [Sporobolomyces pararoseus]